MSTMKIQKYWWLAFLRGLILIVLSIYIFQNPVSALLGVAIYISISFLFTGITQIFVSIAVRKEAENWGWGLAGGIVDLLFGFVLLSNPEMSAASLPFAVGFWLIFSGVMTFVSSFQIKKEGSSSWWLEMLGGLLSILIGYLISSNLILGTLAITTWLGAGLMILGISIIALALESRKGIKSVF
ncbi:HdeD family acid-resistance protein [Algoriphagus namhaensis]|uniref:HdeD family acid-resistance protein n=1 Tax=Algoriphagus namhaensis TaxID=915353 RepID=A0ABV8AUV3_9BACT